MILDLQSYTPNSAEKSNVYDVVIIGGGPAGASAAIYAARADLRTLVIDKGLTAGALGITDKIANYPGVVGPVSGAALVETMRQQATTFGAEFLADKVIGVDFTADPRLIIAGTNTYFARAVVLATGSMGRTSTIPGEAELLGHGVSYCATCDGAFFRNKVVAVVGNNDEALEEALFLTRYAQKVVLVVPTPALTASESLLQEVSTQPGIEIRLSTRVIEIIGESGHVAGLHLRDRAGGDSFLMVSGVFVYLQGGKPIVDYLGSPFEIGANGCLLVDAEMQTSMAGVFAAGDLLCSHVKQAVIAAADGVKAAIAANKYLQGSKVLQADWN